MDADQFVGKGRVMIGEALVADVQYQVRVPPQQYIETSHLTGHGATQGQQPRLRCSLSGANNQLQVSTRYTLVMSDDRKLDFFSMEPMTLDQSALSIRQAAHSFSAFIF